MLCDRGIITLKKFINTINLHYVTCQSVGPPKYLKAINKNDTTLCQGFIMKITTAMFSQIFNLYETLLSMNKLVML